MSGGCLVYHETAPRINYHAYFHNNIVIPTTKTNSMHACMEPLQHGIEQYSKLWSTNTVKRERYLSLEYTSLRSVQANHRKHRNRLNEGSRNKLNVRAHALIAACCYTIVIINEGFYPIVLKRTLHLHCDAEINQLTYNSRKELTIDTTLHVATKLITSSHQTAWIMHNTT